MTNDGAVFKPKRWRIIFWFLAAACFGLVLYIFLPNKPTEEEKLLKTFYSNRSSYERLREMLVADE